MSGEMRLDRKLGPTVVAALVLAGCSASAETEPAPTSTIDYVAAVRPLAYDNAHAACHGHNLTSIAYEFDISGHTVVAVARAWARRNQRDVRMRGAAFRGCRDALRETADEAER